MQRAAIELFIAGIALSDDQVNGINFLLFVEAELTSEVLIAA